MHEGAITILGGLDFFRKHVNIGADISLDEMINELRVTIARLSETANLTLCLRHRSLLHSLDFLFRDKALSVGNSVSVC
jgi:hypothetical protein